MECTVSLQKVFFEWLSQLILWHLLSPVCIGGQLCMYRIQGSTYSLSDSLWILDKLPRCKYACRSHVALILWASPREEGNNQLEHMARSNECSHKTHIIIYIYIYISLEWLLSKGIVLTFAACIKLNVNKKNVIPNLRLHHSFCDRASSTWLSYCHAGKWTQPFWPQWKHEKKSHAGRMIQFSMLIARSQKIYLRFKVDSTTPQ